jgi:CHRD domain
MRRLIILILALAMLALPASAFGGGRPFVVSLTGDAERPGPGDPDGSGTAWFWVNYGQMEICYSIFVENVTLPAVGAHIHKAPVTDPGPVVVPLNNPDATGSSSGCAEVSDAVLLKDILQNPQDYYVNVHTLPGFAAGAVRGQLSK